MKRIKPLIAVTAIWSRISEYPDAIRVPMEDGHVMTYRLDTPQPGFMKAMSILKDLPEGSYQHKGKR